MSAFQVNSAWFFCLFVCLFVCFLLLFFSFSSSSLQTLPDRIASETQATCNGLFARPSVCSIVHFPRLRHVQDSASTAVVFEGGRRRMIHTTQGCGPRNKSMTVFSPPSLYVFSLSYLLCYTMINIFVPNSTTFAEQAHLQSPDRYLVAETSVTGTNAGLSLAETIK